MRKTTMGKAGALLLSLLAAGCAGSPDTADEIITLQTAPFVEATTCTLSNSNGAWSQWDVPGEISILRDSKPLRITCQSVNGWHGHLSVSAQGSISTPFFGNGNKLIAETSDAPPPDTRYQGNPSNVMNGTLSVYPSTIIVPMTPDESGAAY